MNKSLNEKIGARIRKARKNAGLTQIELGKRLKKSGAAIAYLEQGKRRVNPDTMHGISRELGRPLSYFYEEDSDSESILIGQFQGLKEQLDSVRRLIDRTEKARLADEKKRGEQELQYKLLFDNSPLGIMMCDAEGNVIDVNKSFIKIVGYPSRDELLGINILTHPIVKKHKKSGAIRQVLKKGQSLEGEFPLEGKVLKEWGTDICVQYSIIPMKDENGVLKGVQVMLEDIRQRRAVEMSLTESERKFRKAAMAV